MFIEAVLYQARTSTPWRDLPEEFENWTPVSQRFRRWEKRTRWKRLWEWSHRSKNERLQALFINSTIVRDHQHAAGTPNKTADNQPKIWAALGRPVHQATRGLLPNALIGGRIAPRRLTMTRSRTSCTSRWSGSTSSSNSAAWPRGMRNSAEPSWHLFISSRRGLCCGNLLTRPKRILTSIGLKILALCP